MNILKEGVRSALVRLVRYLVFGIIALAIFWLIGLFTNKKASALTIQESIYDPDIVNKEQTYDFWSGSRNAWLTFDFTSNITVNNDYDLLSFKVNQNSSIVYNTGQNQVWEVDNLFVVTPILWQSDNTGIMCYFTSEYQDVFVCPIQRGVSYHGVSLVVNVVDNNMDFIIHYMVIMERNKTYMNYDSTDVINYFSSSGGFANVVVEQQITNTTLTQQYNFIQQNDQQSVNTTTGGSLDTLSGKFNDMLNGWGGQWSTLTRVVFEPIQLLVNIGDTQNTCQPLRLRIPYVSNSTWGDYIIELPCMGNIYNGFFSNFMTVFSTIIVGLYCYRAIIYFLSTIKGVLDAEDDKLEVINL